MRLSQIVRASTRQAQDAPDKWTAKTISVKKFSGSEQVQGFELQTLAVHETLGDSYSHTITHVPTGYALGQVPGDVNRAKKVAEKLLATFSGLGAAQDANAVIDAVKAGGGPAKLKAIFSAAKKGAPKPPWQATWSKELSHALTEYDRKLFQKGDQNQYRLSHLMGALHKAEEYIQTKGEGATLADLQEAILENFTPQSLPPLRALMKKWGIPFDENLRQEAEKRFFKNLAM